MENVLEQIKAEYAILMAVLYCIGCGLKTFKRFPNQYIPLALTGCGVALACLSVASRYAEYANLAAALFEGVVQGILCAGMSVYVNEFVSHCAKGHGSCDVGNTSKKDNDVQGR